MPESKTTALTKKLSLNALRAWTRFYEQGTFSIGTPKTGRLLTAAILQTDRILKGKKNAKR